ncbi:uncharacterized protein BDR25DRAFT_297350 [Lindgomyces ingoldianus]|uniref:Uncharacterized protein n=1 Tax=Lindgomyces ingoldianus TaxID=673940 RepID=A0ACB6QAB0_9PLEO|nr:uncharacterized protein BDR25DRAFT_297350 [Lindgomyces ingoldianus]KAF2463894.1 hypothetical protein BDR25DRAFT_297350 [Lindgomyces ingoldianus]
MCDFTQYAGPSTEWLEVEKKLLALTFDITQEPLILKHAVNDGREQVASKAMETLASKVHMLNHTIPTRDGSTIEARSYRPASKKISEKLPVYLFFHGGGFLFGTLASEDATCAQIAANIGIVVVNVNYRHTPEHTFPIAWLDSQDAFEWLHSHIEEIGGDREKVVVGGISAGGQLSASLVLEQNLGKALTKCPPVAGQVLMIPCVAHIDTFGESQAKQLKNPSHSSYVENKDAPILPEKTVRFFMSLLKTEIPDLKDTKLNPGNATPGDVKGMPPTVFGIAGLDPLRDEALLYAKTLAESGVPTNITLFKGVPHGFRRFGSALSACRTWDECVEKGILWALSNPKATGKFEVKVK